MTGRPVPVVTVDLLRALGACGDQVEEFADLFGDSAVVTEEACAAHAHVFDWVWACEKLLTYEGRREICPGYADVTEACTCPDDETRTDHARRFARAALEHGLVRA